MATHWYEGKIVEIIDETANTKHFFIKMPNSDSLIFRAGQFITMDLPIGEKRLQRWRSYSIASAPHEKNVIELCISKLEGGLGTTYLFDVATIGTIIKFKGADGNFCLPTTIENDLVFICTGTGIAPFRSMLQDIFHTKKAHHKIHLIFGTRYEKDILYRAELEDLALQYPDFQYDIVLSQEKNWNGTKGHLHQIYMGEYADKNLNITFYICGWSKMIDEAVANLTQILGYERSQVVYELYG
jgi:CDP-4-dehydro-6-deoxyglucose reductase